MKLFGPTIEEKIAIVKSKYPEAHCYIGVCMFVIYESKSSTNMLGLYEFSPKAVWNSAYKMVRYE